jgi:hypothetical protein
MATVRAARRGALRRHRKATLPRLDELVTFPQWVEAGQRLGPAGYAFAFLAVDVLLERHGGPAVLDYFRRFATSQDRAGHFRAAFGEDLETFEAGLGARLWK